MQQCRRTADVPSVHGGHTAVCQRVSGVSPVGGGCYILTHRHMRGHGVQPHLIDTAASISVFSQTVGKVIDPFRAELIHPRHVVAVFGHFVQQHRAHKRRVLKVGLQCVKQLLRGELLFVVDKQLDGSQRIGNIGDLDRLHACEIIACAALRHIHPAGQAVVDHRRQKRRWQQQLMHFFDLCDARHHTVGEMVDLLCIGFLQLLKGLIGGQVAEIETRFFTGELIDAVIQCQLQCFEKVEHGSVAPCQRVAVGRQLHAAHDRVVDGVLVVDAVRLQRGNDCLVVEDLRHAAAHGNDAGRRLQKLLRRAVINAQREVRLRKQQMRLRLQEQIAQLVRGVRAVELLSADGNVEADREAGEVLGAVGIAQIHKLVELQPQAFRDLQRVLQRHPMCAAVGKIGIQVLIHPSGRERRGVTLHLQDHI